MSSPGCYTPLANTRCPPRMLTVLPSPNGPSPVPPSRPIKGPFSSHTHRSCPPSPPHTPTEGSAQSATTILPRCDEIGAWLLRHKSSSPLFPSSSLTICPPQSYHACPLPSPLIQGEKARERHGDAQSLMDDRLTPTPVVSSTLLKEVILSLRISLLMTCG